MYQFEVLFLNFCTETATVEKLYYICLSTRKIFVRLMRIPVR